MRFNVRFLLFYVMPMIALAGTLWIVGPEPASGESSVIHYAKLLSAQLLVLAAFAAAAYMTPRRDK